MSNTKTLIELIDEYAETRHRCGCATYNAKTEAARKAVIKALSGVHALSAAPAAKFKVGVLVTKVKGSQWTGRVVGTYSTALAPEGYAVESNTERGSVQIYPAAALELVEVAQAEKSAITSESGAVYAELPEPTTHQIAELKACEHGDAIVGWRVEPSHQSFHASMHPKRTLYTTEQARNFTDRTHALRMEQAAPKAAPGEPLTISPLEEQQMFDDWCPYKGNPDPRTVWAAAIEAVNGMQLCAALHTQAEQQAAPEAAPGVGNSGFDHKTAADFLSGKTVSGEAVRKFVQAARWAHDEKASLSAMLLSVRGVLASREAEIALLKRALMEAEAAPQQEAQEPTTVVKKTMELAESVGLIGPASRVGDLHAAIQRFHDLICVNATIKAAVMAAEAIGKQQAAPQRAPEPLSDDAKDAARYRWLREGNDAKHGAAWYVAVNLCGCEWDAAIDAALAAQGGI